MKEWTLETLVFQLGAKLSKAGYGDILDPMNDSLMGLTVGEMLEALKEMDFRQRVAQIPGQTRIVTKKNGEVAIEVEG